MNNFLFIVICNVLIAFSFKIDNHNKFLDFTLFFSYHLSLTSPARQFVKTLQAPLHHMTLGELCLPGALHTTLTLTSMRSLTTSMFLEAGGTFWTLPCFTSDQQLITVWHFLLLFLFIWNKNNISIFSQVTFLVFLFLFLLYQKYKIIDNLQIILKENWNLFSLPVLSVLLERRAWLDYCL